MAPSVQRRIENAKQRLKGRKPLVFEIKVVPQSAGGEPAILGLCTMQTRCQRCCTVWLDDPAAPAAAPVNILK